MTADHTNPFLSQKPHFSLSPNFWNIWKNNILSGEKQKSSQAIAASMVWWVLNMFFIFHKKTKYFKFVELCIKIVFYIDKNRFAFEAFSVFLFFHDIFEDIRKPIVNCCKSGCKHNMLLPYVGDSEPRLLSFVFLKYFSRNEEMKLTFSSAWNP